MHHIFATLVLCFAPSLALLGYFYLKDSYAPEPLRLLFGVFAGGLLAAPLAILGYDAIGQESFYSWINNIDQAYDGQKLAYCLLAIGPIEELSKFIVVFALVYRLRVFREPLDGMIYAAAAALGFATFENWYVMLTTDSVLWERAVTLPFNHVLFSSFWGYALGVEFCRTPEVYGGTRLVVGGLVLSFIYHGLYDYILLNRALPHLLVLPLVLLLWVWLQSAMNRLQRLSPFRPPDADPKGRRQKTK